MVRTTHEGLTFGNGMAQNGDVSEPTREVVIPLAAEMIGALSRASARSAASVHEEMKEGLNSLANIAYIAPWLGLFATVLTIPNSFVGFDGQRALAWPSAPTGCPDRSGRRPWVFWLG
jgi:hypothetical protein